MPARPRDQALPSVLVLSTADLDAPVWTNKQHLAAGLSAHTEVTFIESMGLRAPTVSTADIARSASKVARMARPRRVSADAPGRADEAMEVVSPRVLPFHGFRLARALNAVSLQQQVRALGIDLSATVLWSFSPMTYGLEDLCRAAVYHSVDLVHEQPGFPRAALLEAERTLLRRCDAVVASSCEVRDHLIAAGGHDVVLWENVADTELFRRTRGERRRRAVFAGNLTPTKVDLSLLAAVVDSGVELHIAGPSGIDGVSHGRELTKLLAHPSVTHHGVLPPERLAALFAECSVGLIPYHLNDYTRGVLPMKVYEYLSAGLPVVSTRLPSVVDQERRGVRAVAPEDYASTVVQALEAFDEDLSDVFSAAASTMSWPSRIRQVMSLLEALG